MDIWNVSFKKLQLLIEFPPPPKKTHIQYTIIIDIHMIAPYNYITQRIVMVTLWVSQHYYSYVETL